MLRYTRHGATAALLAFCILASAGVAWAQEDALREAWQLGSEQSSADLAGAQERVDKLAQRWTGPAAAAAELRWLLEHRTATFLVLDEELPLGATGRRRSLLLHLAMRLQRRELSPSLPQYLATAGTADEELEAIEAMGAVGGSASLEALAGYVREASPATPPALVAAATEGLGRSRSGRYRAPLGHARTLLTSPDHRFRLAVAAHRCGDPHALDDMLRLVGQVPGADRADVVSLLCEDFSDESVWTLARAARRSLDSEAGVCALRAIIEGTGYGDPAAAAPQAEPPREAFVDPALELARGGRLVLAAPDGLPPGLPADIAAMSVDERAKLLEQVLAWWECEGRASFEESRTAAEVS